MRFDMVRLHTGRRSDRLENAELIELLPQRLHPTANFQFLSPEIFPIEKAGMRSNSHSVGFRPQDRRVHRIGIAGVKTSRDAGRADELEQLVVVARAFAKIGVKIDNQIHEVCKLRPMRKRFSSLSRSSKSRCASASETSEKRT